MLGKVCVVMALALAGSAGAATTGTPPLVAAYAKQLTARCPEVKGRPFGDQVDLNGDKIDDWVIDATRHGCGASNSLQAENGALVTVFMGAADGMAYPAFQQAAFGSRLERTGGSTRLVVTVAGPPCEADSMTVKCDRILRWSALRKRFELAQATPLSGTADPTTK
ncbi:hypothetical protein [Phenylobacterium sp.]|uniref:hypothetical protein n=1 Tax=Phenylobacterium sp. TaxID=1871053 RepID=UPI0030F4A3F7